MTFLRNSLLFLVVLFWIAPHYSWSNNNIEEERIRATLRQIGHKLLLASGDSTSRVLPILKEGERFKIEFESIFSFVPDELSFIVDNAIKEGKVATKYIVEVQDCDSGSVVYSYQIDLENMNNLVPCKGRLQPKGCYELLLRIVTPYAKSNGETKIAEIPLEQDSGNSNLVFYIVAVVLLIVMVATVRSKKVKKEVHSHRIVIGKFLFDRRNMTLSHGVETQELTGKETELLQLLHNHLNTTVDRDEILKEVWQDEGAYVGRTLDVYISKLRKKFESDPAVRIVNVRGVGYKLTLN